MANYVDGFVLPVSKDRLDEYRKVAEKAASIYQEHDALAYWECVGDDLDPVEQGMTSFPELVNAREGETVMFSWAVFKSREHRDAANKQIMSDPRLKELMNEANPLFDFKRLAFGGFNVMVQA